MCPMWHWRVITATLTLSTCSCLERVTCRLFLHQPQRKSNAYSASLHPCLYPAAWLFCCCWPLTGSRGFTCCWVNAELGSSESWWLYWVNGTSGARNHKKNMLLHKHPAAKLHRCAQFLTFIARVFVSGRLRAVKGRVTDMSWFEFALLLYFTSLESEHKMRVINARLIVLDQGCQT